MNIGKLVPGVGAVIGGGLDLVETKIIAGRAYKWFYQGNFVGDDRFADADNIVTDLDCVNKEDEID